jgi:hypothetical protein
MWFSGAMHAVGVVRVSTSLEPVKIVV